jgi:cellulose synthase operon protein C
MGDQALLTRIARGATGALLVAWCLAVPGVSGADATPVPTALLPRVGLTAGGYDHFLGQLSPSGEEIVFVGNSDRTMEIYVQRLDRGSPTVLFDDASDVTQPRLSPDGKRLLYISYQQDAAGDACILTLKRKRKRCLTSPGTAVLHVFWYPDGKHVGVLTQERLDAPHQLLRIKADGRRRTSEVVLEQHMASPAISADGRYLAFVALEPDEDGARGSLRRVSRGLVIRRLGDEARSFTFEPMLPGTSSFPAFSPDGQHLYFTQFLNDTNFDGEIDEDDNGVLFRAPLRPERSPPVARGMYEQLTSGRSNCQHPAPARDRLIATCVRAGLLQIYSMPLTGLMPADWSTARMEAEIAASRDPWEQLFILQRLVSRKPNLQAKKSLFRRIVMHQLALREYESADHYLALLGALGRGDAALESWVAIQREIVGHRREEQRLGHGKLNLEFIAAQRARLERLEGIFERGDATTRSLSHLAESEIYLVLGDKAAALEMFESVDLDVVTDVSVLQAWTMIAEVLFRDMGDRPRWLEIHRRLSEHPALDERERLHHARAFVKVLARGRPPGEELPLVAEARRRAPDGSERALMLDLELALLRVTTIGERAAERELAAVWASAPNFERHRAVALTTIRRAAHEDWAYLLHVFGRRWLADVPEDHPERRYADALYEEVMLERAYVELRQHRVDEARGLFRQITEDTPSLEAHVGYVEASLDLGVAHDALRAEYRARFPVGDPIEAFAEAYIVARGLPHVHDDAKHAAEIERARALLRPIAEIMPRSPEVRHLYAYLAHRHYHRTGDNEAARAAHLNYHLALDLSVYDPRRRANILDELGLLQASLQNHRIALVHFAARERLPFIDPRDELSFRLAKARSLFHAASYEEARAESAKAIELARSDPSLAPHLPVVLDRAALYHYASGEHEEAVALYASLVSAVDDRSLAARMKARLGLGAAALAAGELVRAHDVLEEARALLDADEPFRVDKRKHQVLSHFDRDDYRPLVAGLLAWSRRATGDLDGTAAALHERRELFRARHAKYKRDGYLLEIARVSQQLAENAYRRGEHGAAKRYVEEGLKAADTYRERAEVEIEEVSLALVRAAAELHLYGGIAANTFDFDLAARLREAYAEITTRRNPKWADERFLFPIYLTLVDASR